jgi:proteasome assembly chaperone (PAC2) family protein
VPVDVTEVLEFSTGDIGTLERPVMLVGLEGWFDVASAASHAVDSFIDDDVALIVGEIDPDPFYDFTQQRPLVSVDDGVRSIQWPSNEFVVQRNAGHRDIVSIIGVEPHMHWATYVDAIVTVAEALGCEAVVTVGSAAEAIPHTRRPPVTGSTSNTELARRLGLGAPSYEGITGIAGVLQAALEARSIPAVSLRVGIPHYLMNAEHPQATAALARHLSHVLGVPSDVDLSDQIDSWRDVHDEIIEHDDQLRMYVRMLEAEFDRRAEAAIPSAEDLAAEFEDFLDTLRTDDTDDTDTGDDTDG